MNHSVYPLDIWELTLGSETFGAWNLSQGWAGVDGGDFDEVVVDAR
jgi:hypothetical protein